MWKNSTLDDNLHDITVKRQLEDGYELIGIKTALHADCDQGAQRS